MWGRLSADGYGARVFFDERGDSKGRYNIMNFRRNRATRRYEYVTVARWADQLHVDVANYGVNRITWAGGDFRSRYRTRGPGITSDNWCLTDTVINVINVIRLYALDSGYTDSTSEPDLPRWRSLVITIIYYAKTRNTSCGT